MRNNQGFTLVEMLVAIALISLMAAVSLPLSNYAMQNLTLNSALRSLTSDLRYAQQLAVTSQNNYGVIFDLSTKSYQIKNQETQAIIKVIKMSDNISISSLDGLVDNTVTFNAAGAATSTGSIVLINQNDRTGTIEIKPSGYVKIK